MRQSVSVGSVTASNPIRLDANRTNFNVGALLGQTNTSTSTVEYTFDKPDTDPNNATLAADNWANATWWPVTDLTDIAAAGTAVATSAKLDTNVEAVRIDCTAWTSGTVTLSIIQGYTP